MDTAPFQQLESDKTEHLLAEDWDSLQLHSAVRDRPALRTARRRWQLSWELGTWAVTIFAAWHRCISSSLHFSPVFWLNINCKWYKGQGSLKKAAHMLGGWGAVLLWAPKKGYRVSLIYNKP